MQLYPENTGGSFLPTHQDLGTQNTKTIPSIQDSKSNVPTSPFVKTHVVKFDNVKDFRSQARKKDLKLFKEQIPADQAIRSTSIPSKQNEYGQG
jgi:hypothetical protein